MHVAEKYLLGELTEDLREQYEEHLFDCAECAMDLRAAATFIAASKQVFLEEPVAELARDWVQAKGRTTGWRGWLKPLIAVPAMAALVVVAVYEGRQIHERSMNTASSEPRLTASADIGLRGGDRASSESALVRVQEGKAMALHFDFTPSQAFEKYLGEVQDQAGRVVMSVVIPAERTNKEVRFVVPAGRLRAGHYAFVIFGDSAAKTIVAKYEFAVEMIP